MALYDIPIQSSATLLLPQGHEAEIHAGKPTAVAMSTRAATARQLWNRPCTSAPEAVDLLLCQSQKLGTTLETFFL